MLALTFANKADYDKIREDDIFDIKGLTTFAPDKPLTVIIHHSDGKIEDIQVNHTYNKNQIEWFKAGSALNAMGKATSKSTAKSSTKKTTKKAVKKGAKKVAKNTTKPAKKKVVKKKAVKKSIQKKSKKPTKKKSKR